MKNTEVVAALIWRDDKFMICQRPAHKARGLLCCRDTESRKSAVLLRRLEQYQIRPQRHTQRLSSRVGGNDGETLRDGGCYE